MCLMFVYVSPEPCAGDYKLVLVNNRDEFYQRPTSHAHVWPSGVLAGMDMQGERQGGTWLGMKGGRIACLLNIFQPKGTLQAASAPRGFLVVDYLLGQESGLAYMDKILSSGVDYNKFNLVTIDYNGNGFQANYVNISDTNPRPLDPGFHGFGNSHLDSPFRKVSEGKKKFEEIVESSGRKESENVFIEELQQLMQSREQHYPDQQLMSQGAGYDDAFLTGLSSMWVECPHIGYGTRTTTVLLVDREDNVIFKEKTMKEPISLNDVQWEVNDFTFKL